MPPGGPVPSTGPQVVQSRQDLQSLREGLGLPTLPVAPKVPSARPRAPSLSPGIDYSPAHEPHPSRETHGRGQDTRDFGDVIQPEHLRFQPYGKGKSKGKGKSWPSKGASNNKGAYVTNKGFGKGGKGQGGRGPPRATEEDAESHRSNRSRCHYCRGRGHRASTCSWKQADRAAGQRQRTATPTPPASTTTTFTEDIRQSAQLPTSRWRTPPPHDTHLQTGGSPVNNFYNCIFHEPPPGCHRPAQTPR